MLASQSKQAAIGLIVAILIATLRQRSLRRRSKAILVALAPLAVLTFIVATNEVVRYQAHGHNSLQERTVDYTAGLNIWRLNPWLGQGPRWWYLTHFAGVSNRRTSSSRP